MERYADVIVPLAVEGMFTYAVPAALREQVEVGALVLVAFAGNKRYTALVVRVHDRKPEGVEVKEVEGMAEERVRLSEGHVRFLSWVAAYYMATPGEVMKAALPVVFRLESYTAVTRTEEEPDYGTLTEGERRMVAFLKPGEYVAVKDAEKCLNLRNGMAVVRTLMAKGVVRVKETVDELFREKRETVVRWASAFTEEELGRVLDGLKRAAGQYRMLCRWIEMEREEMERGEFLAACGLSAAVLKGLCAKGILAQEERAVSRFGGQEEQGEANGLSAEQGEALQRIREGFAERDCVLLQGVTSSGKTEVYIHLIREYLERGEQVLYMLPEIALTVQIVRRLQRVFGQRVGVYHSGMSDQMRAELWRKQCSEEPFGLILGVRSSVFLPFARLGLVIVDEEHDASYKQKEPAPRYNGRDAAIMLAKMAGAKVLLGSATPSFESYRNAQAGKYGLVELNVRYGGVRMPETVMADLKEFRRKKLMQGSFTPLLAEEMRRVLAEGMQVILFQNRRGYSSYIQCDRCGSIPKCRHCDVSLTYYKRRNALVCRYCGAVVPMQERCGACGEGHYRERTPGTERVEEEVERLFPGSRVARMDLDVMGSKARFRRVIQDFEQGKTDILIGTQMVTKGLDFERVKLVGVMDADSMVNFPDFRAEERAYCMLMQVSGRSGRRGERGKVVIQAADAGNRVYEQLQHGDYASFYRLLADERKLFAYPPFGRLIQVELRHRESAAVRHAANRLARGLREKLGNRVCGPAEPEVARIGGMNRVVLLLKIEPETSVSAVKAWLKEEIGRLKEDKGGGALRIFCDVDP